MPRVPVLVNIPDGYELACEEMRNPQRGDLFLSQDGTSIWEPPNDICSRNPRVILRPAWQWPPWLTAMWICQDSYGDVYATDTEPVEGTYGWRFSGAYIRLSTKLFAFTPPPCTDWRQSKRRNPNLNP